MPKETFHCSCEVHFRTNFSISRRVNKIDTGDPVASRAPTLWIIQISCTLSALTCTQPECWTHALIPNDNTLFWMSPPKSPNLRKKMLEGREEYDLIFMKCIHEIQFTETLPSKPVPTNQPHIKRETMFKATVSQQHLHEEYQQITLRNICQGIWITTFAIWQLEDMSKFWSIIDMSRPRCCIWFLLKDNQKNSIITGSGSLQCIITRVHIRWITSIPVHLAAIIRDLIGDQVTVQSWRLRDDFENNIIRVLLGEWFLSSCPTGYILSSAIISDV